MKIGKEFNQEAWEATFVAFENKWREAFMAVLEAVLAGAVLGFTIMYFMGGAL